MAAVDHGPLPTDLYCTGVINSGNFSLALANGSQVSGTLATTSTTTMPSGSSSTCGSSLPTSPNSGITLTSNSSCSSRPWVVTTQTFEVYDKLASLSGSGAAGYTSGIVEVTLTHYQMKIWGSCQTIGASVAGTLTLSS